MLVTNNPNIYRIKNLTEKKFRFSFGRNLIRFEPEEKKEFDITVNPAIKMLLDEIPNTHKGLFEITQPYKEEIQKRMDAIDKQTEIDNTIQKLNEKEE